MFLTARILLVINALMYVLVGLGVAIRPDLMEELGVSLITATGITTTRTWGALFAGVGLTALLTATKRDWIVVGLLLVVITAACILASRAYGIWIDGIEPRQWVELRREGIGFVIGLTGLGLGLAGQRSATGGN
jgi:hypothetical protein